ncbi:MAG: ABC transporter permease [Actinomycetota bacterium]
MAWGLGAIIAALLLWEMLARTHILPPIAFPSASEVLIRLTSLLPSVAFWNAVTDTIYGAGIGLAIVFVLALPVGIAIGRLTWFDRSVLLVVEFLKPIPPVALLPLALLFWGPSPTMKIFLVIMGAFWPLLVQVVYGSRGLDRTQLDLARSYRLGRWRTIRHIVIPTVTPFALTGLRVSATIAVVVAVVAELIGGAAGLGQQISLAQNAADLPTMYAYIITTGLLGLAVNGLFTLLGKPLLFWHPSGRSKED